MAKLAHEIGVAVSDAVSKALAAEAEKQSNDLTKKDAAKVANPVAHKVEAAVTPFIVHATNQEPWYQSRVTIGAIVAVAGGIAGMAGYTLDAEDQAYWVDSISQGIQLGTSVAALVGGALAWYGRWRAKKPIGE